MQPQTKLHLVKTVHTLVWAVFAAAILAIPVMAYLRVLWVAQALIGLVLIEVVVLLVNRMRCPLTDIAGRYTADRRDNFDIYLPLWLARYNKEVFGTLFVAGVAYTLVVWVQRT